MTRYLHAVREWRAPTLRGSRKPNVARFLNRDSYCDHRNQEYSYGFVQARHNWYHRLGEHYHGRPRFHTLARGYYVHE